MRSPSSRAQFVAVVRMPIRSDARRSLARTRPDGNGVCRISPWARVEPAVTRRVVKHVSGDSTRAAPLQGGSKTVSSGQGAGRRMPKGGWRARSSMGLAVAAWVLQPPQAVAKRAAGDSTAPRAGRGVRTLAAYIPAKARSKFLQGFAFLSPARLPRRHRSHCSPTTFHALRLAHSVRSRRSPPRRPAASLTPCSPQSTHQHHSLRTTRLPPRRHRPSPLGPALTAQYFTPTFNALSYGIISSSQPSDPASSAPSIHLA